MERTVVAATCGPADGGSAAGDPSLHLHSNNGVPLRSDHAKAAQQHEIPHKHPNNSVLGGLSGGDGRFHQQQL